MAEQTPLGDGSGDGQSRWSEGIRAEWFLSKHRSKEAPRRARRFAFVRWRERPTSRTASIIDSCSKAREQSKGRSNSQQPW